MAPKTFDYQEMNEKKCLGGGVYPRINYNTLFFSLKNKESVKDLKCSKLEKAEDFLLKNSSVERIFGGNGKSNPATLSRKRKIACGLFLFFRLRQAFSVFVWTGAASRVVKLESVDLLEIRRNNIQRLVEQYGSFGELNHKMGRSRRDTDIEDVFFAKRDDGSRYTRSRQTMLSHRIERSLGLPSGWMDMENPPIVQEIKNEPEQRKPHTPVQKSALALELEKVVVKNGALEKKAADRAQERLKTGPSVQTTTERTEPQATVRARLLIMRRKKLGSNASPAVLFEQNKPDPLGSAKNVPDIVKGIPTASELKLPAVPVLTETVVSPVQESAQETPAPLPVRESDSCEGQTVTVPVLSSAESEDRQWSETVEIPQRVLAGREKHVLRGYRCFGTNCSSAFAEGAFVVVDISGGRWNWVLKLEF